MDCNTWDWGGTMIAHELWQAEDGALFVKPVPAVLSAVNRPAGLKPEPLTGPWLQTESGWRADTPHGFAAMLAGTMGETWRLSLDATPDGPAARFGVARGVDEAFAGGYYVIVDLNRGRLELQTPVRMSERGGKMFPYEVELERPLPPGDGRTFHLDVVAEGTVLEVYLNRAVALSARMYDRTAGCFGLFASEGAAGFDSIRSYGQ